MHHVYYRQQYQHPQLGRALKVLGTGVALHYGPDEVLRRANLAQVNDVPLLPAVALSTPEQAFAAAQMALASRPGFRLGNTGQWPPGALASILEHAELVLAIPPGGGPLQQQWQVTTLDASLVPYSAVVDAVNGQLLGVGPSNPGDCPQPSGCAHCSPGYDGWPTEPDPWPLPSLVPAKARPENASLIPCGQTGYGCGSDGYRDVNASPLTIQYENETNCGGATCSYEAVWVGGDGIPQIEVYHGMPNTHYYQHCGVPYHEGKYMRVGLMEVVPDHPTYDEYGGGSEGKALPTFVPHALYRIFAGDAMYYTYKTMEVFRDYFERCGFDGACAIPARVVVDAGTVAAEPGPDDGCTDDAAYFAHGEWTLFAPEDGVGICHASPGKRSKSAAQDIVAHEWGHAVDKHSGGDLAGRCDGDWVTRPDTCEMSEGFADVVGHIVERLTQPNEDAGSWSPERWDWIAGEDWSPWDPDPELDPRQYLRRAHEYDTHTSGPRWSVHAEDPGYENDGTPDHANGNRLSVVLKLMTDRGFNPASSHITCTNCDLEVSALDPTDPVNSFQMAAQILFRVLDTEADSTTVDWDDLPTLARNAVQDLYWWDHTACVGAQVKTIDAFRAVGYPQSGSPPCVACFPFQQGVPPCCPPDWECIGEPE